MNIVLAYDGSDCADRAIEGLRSAGIPDESEITVLSVSEWFPVPADTGVSGLSADASLANNNEAARLAETAAQQLREEYPGWKVRAEGCVGSAAHEIVRFAEEQNAELIVTGSHGRSAVGRFFLGSVSHQIVTKARCNVRISRYRDNGETPSSPTILIALDGSNYAEPIFDAVLNRQWPPDTTFRIVSAAEYSNQREEQEMSGHLQRLHADIGESLKAKGFSVESVINTEIIHPKEAILIEAERTGAECIVLGARGLTQFERLVLGSVSTAIAMQATCSVEIVHRKKQKKQKEESRENSYCIR